MKNSFYFCLVTAVFTAFNINNVSAQWYSIPQLKNTTVYCSLSAGDSTIFVGGDNMTLLKSTDNGISWASVMHNGIAADTILSLGAGLGYIFAGANGVDDIYRTSDQGNSWSTANNGLNGIFIINQFALSDSLLFAASNGGIFSSSDSGKSWHVDTAGLNLGFIIPNLNNNTIGIAAVGTKLYTIMAFSGAVYTSNISPMKWKPISENYFRTGFAIAAVDSNIFIAAQQGIFLDDGDTAWIPKNNGLPVNDTTFIIGCKFTAVDSLLFAYILSSSTYSYSKDVYVTSDFGNNWKKVNDSVAVSNNINTIAANNNYLFAGTQAGEWRISISDLLTPVINNNPQTPIAFNLFQNYPNPFNPTTIIKYQIPNSNYITLKVYDVLGNLVKTLVDGYKNSGSYSIQFNAGNLASGVYFYQLHAGNYTITKKLMLLK